jgi:hypothetical protein
MLEYWDEFSQSKLNMMLAHELNNHFMIFCEVITSKDITHVHNVTHKIYNQE